MTRTKIEYDHYVDFALDRAQEYIQENLSPNHTGRLDGKNPEETVEIEGYLRSNPYSTAEMRETIVKMLKDIVGVADGSSGGKRTITYLSGALGSKDELREFAGNSEYNNPAIENLRQELSSVVASDFAFMKALYTNYTGESTEPYGKVRALLSGIDQTISQIVKDHKLSLIVDNTLAAVNEADGKSIIQTLAAYKADYNLQIYAMALTEREAETLAEKHGLDPKEAKKTAVGFNKMFYSLCQVASDVVLLDRKGTIIYEQKNGKIVQEDLKRLSSWNRHFAPVGSTNRPSFNPE